jgi:hypothetical protein
VHACIGFNSLVLAERCNVLADGCRYGISCGSCHSTGSASHPAMMSNPDLRFPSGLDPKAMADIQEPQVYGCLRVHHAHIRLHHVARRLHLQGSRSSQRVSICCGHKRPGDQLLSSSSLWALLLYHLYNQFAFNTLQRVTPCAHGVCNVVAYLHHQRVRRVLRQPAHQPDELGTAVALAGTWLYTEMTKRGETRLA